MEGWRSIATRDDFNLRAFANVVNLSDWGGSFWQSQVPPLEQRLYGSTTARQGFPRYARRMRGLDPRWRFRDIALIERRQHPRHPTDTISWIPVVLITRGHFWHDFTAERSSPVGLAFLPWRVSCRRTGRLISPLAVVVLAISVGVVAWEVSTDVAEAQEFKTETAAVVIDVIARDRREQPVLDLRADEFE